jgi:hypothetical protein
MKIEDLSPEADGGLRPGDVLVAIGGINVRKMPLSRGVYIYIKTLTIISINLHHIY